MCFYKSFACTKKNQIKKLKTFKRMKKFHFAEHRKLHLSQYLVLSLTVESIYFSLFFCFLICPAYEERKNAFSLFFFFSCSSLKQEENKLKQIFFLFISIFLELSPPGCSCVEYTLKSVGGIEKRHNK